jgi:hypothetical protein
MNDTGRHIAMVIVTAVLLMVSSDEVAAALVYDWDAAGDTGGDNTWESEITPTQARNWTFDKNATPVDVTGSSFDGLGKAYYFGGSGTEDPATAQTTTFEGSDLNNGDSDASFEFWLKPDDLTGQEVIFETGADKYGIGFALDGQTLKAAAHDNGVGPFSSYDLSSESSYNSGTGSFDDFIQIVGVSDGDTVYIYVNGAQRASNTYAGRDTTWESGKNDAGLGSINSDVLNEFSGYGSFEGKIARVRFYDEPLSGTEVGSAYTAMIPEPSTLSIVFLMMTVAFLRRYFRGK